MSQVNSRPAQVWGPLSSWLANASAVDRFRRRHLDRSPAVLPPRDAAWRSVAPTFDECLGLAESGMPFQITADRRYDRSANATLVRPALAEGKTVFLPQVHQVLPRLMRLMVALRGTYFRASSEECSFLFLAGGRGREGMGLHHDGDVESIWLQLEGRRTVTLGPPVPRGTPEDLPDSYARGWSRGEDATLELPPGTLFYMPPHTPHRVLYYGWSLALSLTWRKPLPRGAGGNAVAATDWDVVSGRADRIPPLSRSRLWTQVPAVAGPMGRSGRDFALRLGDGADVRMPAGIRPLAEQLATMVSWPLTKPWRERLAPLIEQGIVAPRDLPLRIIPEDPRALDGWRFA